MSYSDRSYFEMSKILPIFFEIFAWYYSDSYWGASIARDLRDRQYNGYPKMGYSAN